MLGGIFDKNKIKEKIQVFDKKIANEDFWKDKIVAQKILKEKKFFDNIINNSFNFPLIWDSSRISFNIFCFSPI